MKVYSGKAGDVVQITSDSWFVAVEYTDDAGRLCTYWRELTLKEMLELED